MKGRPPASRCRKTSFPLSLATCTEAQTRAGLNDPRRQEARIVSVLRASAEYHFALNVGLVGGRPVVGNLHGERAAANDQLVLRGLVVIRHLGHKVRWSR